MDLVGVNATANTVGAQLYSVVVVDKSTGCQTIQTETVPSTADFPVVSASVISNSSNCTGAGNGSASADVGGSTGGYKFYWYD